MGLLTDLIEKKVERAHSDEEDRKKKLREFYYDRIHDENTDPKVREQITNDYLKILSPEAKKHAQQGLGVIGKLKAAFGGGPKPAQQQAAQPQQPVGPPQYAPGAADKNPGIPTVTDPAKGGEAQPVSPVQKFNAGPGPAAQPTAPTSNFFKDYGEDAQNRKMANEKKEYDAWLERGKEVLGKDASPRDLAEYAGSKGARLPTAEKRIADKGVARPGEDPSTGKPYEGLWDHTQEKDGTETWAKRPDVVKGSTAIRSVPHSVSLQDARTQAENGAVFKDQEGKELALDKLPPDVGLQAMVSGDKMFWVPITPNQKTVTVGNVVYATNPYNVTQVGQAGGPPALGVQRTGTSNTPTQVVTDAQGVPHVLGSTSQPNTPGARPTATPAAAPSARKPGAPSAAATPAAAPAGGPRGIQGVPIGMYNQERNRAIPVREAATQIFGDPSQPDIKGLKDYIPLADNPESRERLGKALRLTFDGLNQATGGSHISAEAGPISVSTGGIGSVLQNYFGVPAKLAEQQSEIMGKAIGDLTPEEKEYYNSVMSSFSTIVGLRSLTKASAAQASVSAIERELPVIGVNTFDSRQGYDQMQRLAEVVSNGTIGMPPGMIDPALVKRIKDLPSQMQKLKTAKPASAPDKKGPAKSARPQAVNPQTGEKMEYDGKAWVKVAQ